MSARITAQQITPGMVIDLGASSVRYNVVSCNPSKVGMRAVLEWAGRTREAHILDGETVYVVYQQ